MGRSLAKMGDLAAADALFRESLALDPTDAEAWESRGIVAEMRGERNAAAEFFRAAVEQQPGFRYALRRLGWIRATSPDAALRDGERAVVLFERAAAQNDFGAAADLDGLAAALAEAGRFEAAAGRALEAAERYREDGDSQGAGRSEDRAEQYLRGVPLRLR